MKAVPGRPGCCGSSGDFGAPAANFGPAGLAEPGIAEPGIAEPGIAEPARPSGISEATAPADIAGPLAPADCGRWSCGAWQPAKQSRAVASVSRGTRPIEMPLEKVRGRFIARDVRRAGAGQGSGT